MGNNVISLVIMLCAPSLLALMIHAYLRHGEIEICRKIKLYILYFFLLNIITYTISWIRGVKGFQPVGMTMSYKLKYLGLASILGFIIPFPVCLFTEEVITLGGVRRYARRFFRDIKKYLSYTIRVAKADLHAEVANSYLSWMWWLIEPFCMMIIYTVIFGIVFKASEDYFPVFVFIGITMWGFFSRSVSDSVDIVRLNRDIITRIYIPKYILLLSRMFVNAFKMCVSFAIVIAMLAVFQVPVCWTILFFVPVILIFFLITFGIGTILMHYGVYVNDLGYITGIVLNILMYATGIFYDVAKQIPAPFGVLLETYNPPAYLIKAMRGALMYGEIPDLWMLLVYLLIAFVLMALGIFTVYSNENAYVKVL